MDPGQQGEDRLCVCPAAEEHQTTVGTGVGRRLLAPNTLVLPCFPFGSSPKITGALSQSLIIAPAISPHQLQGCPRTAASGPSGQPLQSLRRQG